MTTITTPTVGTHYSQAISAGKAVNITNGVYPLGTNTRWQFALDGTTESGSNAGSNLILNAIADDGKTIVGAAMTVTRSSGNVNIPTLTAPATALTSTGAVSIGTLTVTTNSTITGTETAGTLVVTTGATITGAASAGTLTVGSGTPIKGITKYNITLSPAGVAPNTSAEQTFTCTGLLATDVVTMPNKPTVNAGLVIGGVRAVSANSVGINFGNLTGSTITPTASQGYLLMAFST